MKELVSKLKEVSYAVLPIIVIVLILNFTLTPLSMTLISRFLIGAGLIIIGLSIFLFGVDIGITPIGNFMGSIIAKTNKIWKIVISGLILGFIISIAEPDLHILAGQVDFVTTGLISKLSIVVVVSIGIGIMLSLGLARIVRGTPLKKMLTILYSFICILAIFTSKEFLAISFDASGATTGAMTVPFILALAMGVVMLKKGDKNSEEDSFGLVAIASTGAIISVMIMNIISKTDKITGSLEYHESMSSSIISPFIEKIPTIAGESFLALIPILLIFLVFQKVSINLSKKDFNKILIGLLFTFMGLILFLVGVNAGFMDVGSAIGYEIASLDSKAYVIIIGFILGVVTIFAEPAVYVLMHQIEEVTNGHVNRKAVMFTLSIGVGLAVALSMLRILIPQIQLWHYLLPGYLISIVMTYFVPNLFVGIAFDSGGVASGPMTATFILAFAQGVAESIEGANVLVDGFGVIAMVALTPLIALQVLGLIFKIKSEREDVKNIESSQECISS
ncbi:TPA: DUF1538 domain-containing protein [Clostridium botulinum]|nr:DUF1538 domain-containing protein [Clostridium botulinum]HCL4457607.1 DUF1538 domain-containing protein [Clostridium botulinum]HCL4461314.1 DUF1538 domain-containing protein [Clostridium botulinum]HCL4472371.1 DUF1538 domain-containing protein [Clostridium botulinum]HCL4475965.1 DUF1538 domain-containing protein [Clostridium botulinum]